MTYQIDTFPGREITVIDKKYLYFGGTSYLGLQTDPDFQELFIKNIKKYGTNYGASRKSNVRISVFEHAEKQLAQLVGCEACATLSSGYLAGQLLAQTFSDPSFKTFYAPNAHSALYQQTPEHYTDYESLNEAVRSHLASEAKSTAVVFLDSIDFGGLNYPVFKGLRMLPLDKLILVVDDSHGIGVVGENGSGVYKNLRNLFAKELVICCSLGKGLGIQAGAVFGGEERIKTLTETDFFGGASPASPAALQTFIDASDIYFSKRKVLKRNCTSFKELLTDHKMVTGVADHPAFSFSDSQLVKHLEENGIIVTNFNYPNEDAALMSRIVISAHHTLADIQYLTAILNSYKV